MCFCGKKSARVFYWIGIILIIGFAVALGFSVIYLYLPHVNNYRDTECQIISCTDTVITCCKPLISSEYCVGHTYPNVTFALETVDGNKYTKSETHICNGPIGQNDWVYHEMCRDPNLRKKIPCFYDISDLPNSLHLTRVFQTTPPLGVAAVTFCVVMLVSWIAYLIFYCVIYRKAY